MKRLFFVILMTFAGCSSQSLQDARTAKIIMKGDIRRTEYTPGQEEAGSYLSNGRFGAVFMGLGLNSGPGTRDGKAAGASHFSHLDHWGRFRFVSAQTGKETTADYLLPLFRLFWEEEPGEVSSYSQRQSFYDGTLSTSFVDSSGSRTSVLSWFDRDDRDVAGLLFRVSGRGAVVRCETVSDFVAYPYVFRDKVVQNTFVEKAGGAFKVTVSCPQALNGCESTLYIYSSSEVEICGNGLRFILSPGENRLLISYGHPLEKESLAESHDRTVKGWHQLWAGTGWMDFPDQDLQAMWVRSMAYLLESYEDTGTGLIQPTNGLSGNPFPFHFVQDLGYIAPALMMTGHAETVRAWVEKFALQIEDMKAYAKRLWPESEGIYPPWELPYGSIEGYHEPEPPVAFCYEPHNVGYLARMARECSDYYRDPAWSRKFAFPLLKECARFYGSACSKGPDGKWHLSWYPSVGQDEAGGRNKSDYLCSLYSAHYTFRAAVDAGLDGDGTYSSILADGLAFESLMSENGTLHTASGADDFGRQKHPVQLDGISYFPRCGAPAEYERKAYEVRHGITERAREPYFFGWTLGQFLLAGSNLGDSSGWLEDWSAVLPSGYADKDLVQIYETSRKPDFSFYTTTHGMIAQSLVRNYVNDYWGTLDIGACDLFPGRMVSFSNISTIFGVKVSGWIRNGRARIRLRSGRAVSFRMNGMDVAMDTGEERKFVIATD